MTSARNVRDALALPLPTNIDSAAISLEQLAMMERAQASATGRYVPFGSPRPPARERRCVSSFARLVLTAVLASSASLLLGSCGPDETLTVRTTRDGAGMSLRAAVEKANALRAESVTIELPAGTYPLTLCGADDDNVSGDLDLLLNVPITIIAPAGNAVIQQTCAGDRVLEQHGFGLLTLSGVTITGGSLVGTPHADGGAVRAGGNVALKHATITGNSTAGANAQGPGEGTDAIAGGAARGGGLSVAGSLVAVESVLSFNRASGGNGIYRPPEDLGVAAAGGSAEGGGAYVAGSITWLGGSIDQNEATSGAAGGQSRGGGLAQHLASTSPVALTDTTLSHNRAYGSHAVQDTPEASNGASGGALASSGSLSLVRVRATENVVNGGSAPFVLSYRPRAGDGRGGAVAATGPARVADSTFDRNTAQGASLSCGSITGPGGVPANSCWTGPGAGSAAGGGLGSALWVSGPATLQRSSFTHNAGIGGAGLVVFYYEGYRPYFMPLYGTAGSAVHATGTLDIDGGDYVSNKSAITSGGSAIIQGATLYANVTGVQATRDLRLVRTQILGGDYAVRAQLLKAESVTIAAAARLAVQAAESAALVNVTLTNNGDVFDVPELELEHVTVADNGRLFFRAPSRWKSRASAVLGREGGALCAEAPAVISSSYSWFSDASCGLTGTGDQQGSGEFSLQVLADNGGSVQTRALVAGSVLVDRVPPAECSLAVDARGTPRPQGAGCDIGAFELLP